MATQIAFELENLRNREERATLDYFNAIRCGAEERELRRLLCVLDEIYCDRRRREGVSVDW